MPCNSYNALWKEEKLIAEDQILLIFDSLNILSRTSGGSE